MLLNGRCIPLEFGVFTDQELLATTIQLFLEYHAVTMTQVKWLTVLAAIKEVGKSALKQTPLYTILTSRRGHSRRMASDLDFCLHLGKAYLHMMCNVKNIVFVLD